MTHIDRTCHHTTKQITCRPAHLLIPQSHSEFLELMNNVKNVALCFDSGLWECFGCSELRQSLVIASTGQQLRVQT